MATKQRTRRVHRKPGVTVEMKPAKPDVSRYFQRKAARQAGLERLQTGKGPAVKVEVRIPKRPLLRKTKAGKWRPISKKGSRMSVSSRRQIAKAYGIVKLKMGSVG